LEDVVGQEFPVIQIKPNVGHFDILTSPGALDLTITELVGVCAFGMIQNGGFLMVIALFHIDGLRHVLLVSGAGG
jgi:hypothetical protein